MVRQKSRKTVEELYTTVPPPSSLATTRFDENFFQNSKLNKTQKTNDKTEVCIHSNVACRKKSRVNGSTEKKDEKTFINEERLMGKTKKSEEISPFSFETKQQEDNEKDDDTEEFFGLIKETVGKAVQKAVSDAFVRNFRDISAKIDELGERVHANETALEKIQTELNNKIVHYGEENSRHFRYLCMKSEYDKMFYQHQNVVTATAADFRPNMVNPYPQQLVPPSEPNPQSIYKSQTLQPIGKQHQPIPPCNFVSKPDKNGTTTPQCKCQNPVCEGCNCAQNLQTCSTKSSEMDIKEVKDLLEQLQKFYEHHTPEKTVKKVVHGNDNVNIQDQDDSADGDEDDDSSDMSSPSIEENLGDV